MGSPPGCQGNTAEMPRDAAIALSWAVLHSEDASARRPHVSSAVDVGSTATEASHCGQTWPPITLPCGGIVWQQRGQKSTETFQQERKAAKINIR